MAEAPQPHFGDLVENGWASEENPTRRGFFVRAGRRAGKMNAGPYWEITDGKGKFWECPLSKDHKLTWAPVRRPPVADAGSVGAAEPVAWRSRHVSYVEWTLSRHRPLRDNIEVEPLYATPPALGGWEPDREVLAAWLFAKYRAYTNLVDFSQVKGPTRDKWLSDADTLLTLSAPPIAAAPKAEDA